MTLIACSHGTRFPEGRDAIHALIAQVERLLPDVRIAEAFVDVQEPSIDDVVAGAEGPAVIVPLLLSAGFHTGVDIARAARTRDDVVATDPLGPHPLLAETLLARLREAGLRDGDFILALDDYTVRTLSDLSAALRHYRGGDHATLTIERYGKTFRLPIVFDSKDDAAQDEEPTTSTNALEPSGQDSTRP